MKKTDWIQRLRPTAILFGLMITAIAIVVIYSAATDREIPTAGWTLLGTLGGGLVAALTELIRKNGGE